MILRAISAMTAPALLAILAAAVSAQLPPAMTAPAPRPFRVITLDPGFERLIAPDVTVQRIATIPGLRGEGPIWHKDRLWLSDMAGNRIIDVARDGHVRIVATGAGGTTTPGHPTLQGPNGLANWRNSSVLVARQGARDVAVLDRRGRMKPVVADLGGRRFNSPNDVVAGPDGAVWFTDPPLSLAWHPLSRPARVGASPTAPGHKADQQIPFAGVFRVHGAVARPVIEDMATPNGLAFSPDGRTLYVNNAYPDMYLRAYTVGRGGALSNGRELYRIPPDTGWGTGVPDGMKIDVAGNIWMTGPGGLLVLSPGGTLLGRIQLPNRATNFTFGDDRALYVVSSPDILRIATRIVGFAAPYSSRR